MFVWVYCNCVCVCVHNYKCVQYSIENEQQCKLFNSVFFLITGIWFFIFQHFIFHFNASQSQSVQLIDTRETRTLQGQLDKKERQLQANSQELHRIHTQMEESKKSLETKLKQEKETCTELEARLAIVEDELMQVNESKEKLSTEFSSLQGKLDAWTLDRLVHLIYPMLSPMWLISPIHLATC